MVSSVIYHSATAHVHLMHMRLLYVLFSPLINSMEIVGLVLFARIGKSAGDSVQAACLCQKAAFLQMILTFDLFGLALTLTFDLKIQSVHLCSQRHLSCNFGLIPTSDL